ncbi:MAG TPA: DUF6152 family protein [Gammaproteobacteria bacterium]|nr:DUF6152 family protein [Gammaproteobacteria bacterium]
MLIGTSERGLRCAAGAILVIVSVLAGAVSAHHSRAGFESDAVAAVQGIVTRFSWTNPHVYIEVDASDGSGAQWLVETDAIPILIRSGWSAQSLQVGDSVLVRVNPGTGDEARHGLLVSVTKVDGSVLLPRAHFERDFAAKREEAKADSLAGVWELPFGETGDFMRSWAAVALTDKGRAAREAFRPEDRPAGQCIPTPTPMLMGMPYLNEIELHEDMVILRSEFFDVERVVHMDGRDHPQDAPRTIQGHSIGWWEDEVLVVDTRFMADHRAPIRGPNEGVPSGAERHVVERYRLSENGKRITIDVRVEDPEYLAEPFEGTLEWVHVPDFELSSFSCQSR